MCLRMEEIGLDLSGLELPPKFQAPTSNLLSPQLLPAIPRPALLLVGPVLVNGKTTHPQPRQNSGFFLDPFSFSLTPCSHPSADLVYSAS